MNIFEYLSTELLFNQFIIEIFDRNGFDNIIKLKIMNEDRLKYILAEVSSEIETYKYFKKYDPIQYEQYEAMEDKSAFKLKLKPGDYWQVSALPELLGSVPQQTKKILIKEPPKYTRPRATPRKVTDVSKQLSQKPKLIADLDRLAEKFGKFAKRMDPNAPCQVVDSGKENPEFLMLCTKCNTELRIGFKVSTATRLPNFVHSNWRRHKCNKIARVDVKVQNDEDPLVYEEEFQ